MSFYKLPQEVLQRIFLEVDIFSICSFITVCKLFRTIDFSQCKLAILNETAREVDLLINEGMGSITLLTAEVRMQNIKYRKRKFLFNCFKIPDDFEVTVQYILFYTKYRKYCRIYYEKHSTTLNYLDIGEYWLDIPSVYKVFSRRRNCCELIKDYAKIKTLRYIQTFFLHLDLRDEDLRYKLVVKYIYLKNFCKKLKIKYFKLRDLNKIQNTYSNTTLLRSQKNITFCRDRRAFLQKVIEEMYSTIRNYL